MTDFNERWIAHWAETVRGRALARLFRNRVLGLDFDPRSYLYRGTVLYSSAIMHKQLLASVTYLTMSPKPDRIELCMSMDPFGPAQDSLGGENKNHRVQMPAVYLKVPDAWGEEFRKNLGYTLTIAGLGGAATAEKRQMLMKIGEKYIMSCKDSVI